MQFHKKTGELCKDTTNSKCCTCKDDDCSFVPCELPALLDWDRCSTTNGQKSTINLEKMVI